MKSPKHGPPTGSQDCRTVVGRHTEQFGLTQRMLFTGHDGGSHTTAQPPS